MIEFAALLLVSTLFGGMMLYSFGFAPMVFSALPAEAAGRFIRAVFPWYYLFVIVTAGFSGAILLLSNSRSAALALAISAVAIYALAVTHKRLLIFCSLKKGSTKFTRSVMPSAICATSRECVSRFRKKSDSWPGNTCVLPCNRRKLDE